MGECVWRYCGSCQRVCTHANSQGYCQLAACNENTTCKCYRVRESQSARYSPINGSYIGSVPVKISYCTGTKECEECSCGGDTTKCDFYPEKRNKVETNMFDKREVYDNCTVEVFMNTITGEVSYGWWKNTED